MFREIYPNGSATKHKLRENRATYLAVDKLRVTQVDGTVTNGYFLADEK